MESYIKDFIYKSQRSLGGVSTEAISRVLNLLHSVYEKDGRIYIFGNGGSLALATHWVSDFNKTVFSYDLDHFNKRFQAIRVPTTEAELTAWANDVGFDMVFAGPLKNYLQPSDIVIAISSSGNSLNIIKGVELAKELNIPVIGLSGFDGGKLKDLADINIHIDTEKGEYEVVEGVHGVVLHLIIRYFRKYFESLAEAK